MEPSKEALVEEVAMVGGGTNFFLEELEVRIVASSGKTGSRESETLSYGRATLVSVTVSGCVAPTLDSDTLMGDAGGGREGCGGGSTVDFKAVAMSKIAFLVASPS